MNQTIPCDMILRSIWWYNTVAQKCRLRTNLLLWLHFAEWSLSWWWWFSMSCQACSLQTTSPPSSILSHNNSVVKIPLYFPPAGIGSRATTILIFRTTRDISPMFSVASPKHDMVPCRERKTSHPERETIYNLLMWVNQPVHQKIRFVREMLCLLACLCVVLFCCLAVDACRSEVVFDMAICQSSDAKDRDGYWKGDGRHGSQLQGKQRANPRAVSYRSYYLFGHHRDLTPSWL